MTEPDQIPEAVYLDAAGAYADARAARWDTAWLDRDGQARQYATQPEFRAAVESVWRARGGLPAGAQVVEEWGVRYPGREVESAADLDRAEMFIANMNRHAQSWGRPERGELVRRQVITTPWTPPTAQEWENVGADREDALATEEVADA